MAKALDGSPVVSGIAPETFEPISIGLQQMTDSIKRVDNKSKIARSVRSKLAIALATKT
jgi:hypothetical protein